MTKKYLILLTAVFCLACGFASSAQKEVVSSGVLSMELSKTANKRKKINVLIQLASAYLQEGQLDNSLMSCREALALDPDRKQKQKLYNILGETYGQKKEWFDAIANYQEAITYAPKHIGVLLVLAEAYEQNDLYELAIQEYLKILEMNSNSFEANFGLAGLYLKDGFINKAIKCYRTALSQRMDIRAYRNLSLCYASRGDTDLAISILKNAIAIEPSYDDYVNLGNLYAQKNDFTKAREAFLLALQINPKLIDAYVYLGKLHLEKNDLAGAKEAFVSGSEKFPNSALIHFFLSEIYYKKKLNDLAIKEIRASIKLASDKTLKAFSRKYLDFLQKNSR